MIYIILVEYFKVVIPSERKNHEADSNALEISKIHFDAEMGIRIHYCEKGVFSYPKDEEKVVLHSDNEIVH